MMLETARSQNGPWRRVSSFRALRSPLKWQRVELGEAGPRARFFRLRVRREGHATFRHALHGVLFHCEPEKVAEAAAT